MLTVGRGGKGVGCWSLRVHVIIEVTASNGGMLAAGFIGSPAIQLAAGR